jgi:protein TonB
MIYTNPQVMKVKIKGDKFKLSEKKKENDMVVENVPSGVYHYKFITEYKILTGSFLVPANDTLVVLANNEDLGQESVTLTKMEEIRETLNRITREKSIRDSIREVNKKLYMERVIQNELEVEQEAYEPSDEEILAKTENTDSIHSEDPDEFFYIVEEMPTFNRGEPAIEFRKYIVRNMTFGDDTCQLQLQKKLTVVSQFIVGSDGYIRDIEIISENVPTCIEEKVIELLFSSPRWLPGFQKGRPVNVRINFPITFIQAETE